MNAKRSCPVLILGAKSDIARALADQFAARGHPLQLAARDLAALERDRDDLALRHGVPVSLHYFDALELDKFEEFLDNLPELPRIVVCTIGLLPDQDEAARDSALARHVINSNLTGPVLILEAAGRRLSALDESTALIGISSVAGDRGRARNYVYGAAKAGFSAWLSGMHQKYARSRLHVMTIKPGFVATAMTERMDLPKILTTTPERLARRIVASLDRRRIVHYDMKWRVIMAIVKLIPERMYARLRF